MATCDMIDINSKTTIDTSEVVIESELEATNTNRKGGRKMPICPECLSRDMVKFGTYNNQRRWRCMQCGYTTIYPCTRMPKNRIERNEQNKYIRKHAKGMQNSNPIDIQYHYKHGEIGH